MSCVGPIFDRPVRRSTLLVVDFFFPRLIVSLYIPFSYPISTVFFSCFCRGAIIPLSCSREMGCLDIKSCYYFVAFLSVPPHFFSPVQAWDFPRSKVTSRGHSSATSLIAVSRLRFSSHFFFPHAPPAPLFCMFSFLVLSSFDQPRPSNFNGSSSRFPCQVVHHRLLFPSSSFSWFNIIFDCFLWCFTSLDPTVIFTFLCDMF